MSVRHVDTWRAIAYIDNSLGCYDTNIRRAPKHPITNGKYTRLDSPADFACFRVIAEN